MEQTEQSKEDDTTNSEQKKTDTTNPKVIDLPKDPKKLMLLIKYANELNERRKSRGIDKEAVIVIPDEVKRRYSLPPTMRKSTDTNEEGLHRLHKTKSEPKLKIPSTDTSKSGSSVSSVEEVDQKKIPDSFSSEESVHTIDTNRNNVEKKTDETEIQETTQTQQDTTEKKEEVDSSKETHRKRKHSKHKRRSLPAYSKLKLDESTGSLEDESKEEVRQRLRSDKRTLLSDKKKYKHRRHSMRNLKPVVEEEQKPGVLTIRIIQARKIITIEESGIIHPYVYFYDEAQGIKTKKQTDIKESSVNPQWNSQFGLMLKNYVTAKLRFVVMDYDKSGAKFCGEVRLRVNDLKLQSGVPMKKWWRLRGVNTGEIELEFISQDFSFDPNYVPLPTDSLVPLERVDIEILNKYYVMKQHERAAKAREAKLRKKESETVTTEEKQPSETSQSNINTDAQSEKEIDKTTSADVKTPTEETSTTPTDKPATPESPISPLSPTAIFSYITSFFSGSTINRASRSLSAPLPIISPKATDQQTEEKSDKTAIQKPEQELQSEKDLKPELTKQEQQEHKPETDEQKSEIVEQKPETHVQKEEILSEQKSVQESEQIHEPQIEQKVIEKPEKSEEQEQKQIHESEQTHETQIEQKAIVKVEQAEEQEQKQIDENAPTLQLETQQQPDQIEIDQEKGQQSEILPKIVISKCADNEEPDENQKSPAPDTLSSSTYMANINEKSATLQVPNLDLQDIYPQFQQIPPRVQPVTELKGENIDSNESLQRIQTPISERLPSQHEPKPSSPDAIEKKTVAVSTEPISVTEYDIPEQATNLILPLSEASMTIISIWKKEEQLQRELKQILDEIIHIIEEKVLAEQKAEEERRQRELEAKRAEEERKRQEEEARRAEEERKKQELEKQLELERKIAERKRKRELAKKAKEEEQKTDTEDKKIDDVKESTDEIKKIPKDLDIEEKKNELERLSVEKKLMAVQQAAIQSDDITETPQTPDEEEQIQTPYDMEGEIRDFLSKLYSKSGKEMTPDLVPQQVVEAVKTVLFQQMGAVPTSIQEILKGKIASKQTRKSLKDAFKMADLQGFGFGRHSPAPDEISDETCTYIYITDDEDMSAEDDDGDYLSDTEMNENERSVDDIIKELKPKSEDDIDTCVYTDYWMIDAPKEMLEEYQKKMEERKKREAELKAKKAKQKVQPIGDKNGKAIPATSVNEDVQNVNNTTDHVNKSEKKPSPIEKIAEMKKQYFQLKKKCKPAKTEPWFKEMIRYSPQKPTGPTSKKSTFGGGGNWLRPRRLIF